MSTHDVHASPQRLEIRLGLLLRAGVIAAATVVLIGGVIYLSRHWHEAPAYHNFRGQPVELRTLHGILPESTKLHALGIIQLGLLLLIATPIARVAFAAYGFARQRDWVYVGISTFVLSLLLYGLLVSK